MTEFHNVGIVGLGVMGQRMLGRLVNHSHLRATHIFDANPRTVARTIANYPQLTPTASAEALIAAPGLASLYIATPPAPHMALSNRAFDAGLAVFCEEPLTVDFESARQTIARLDREGVRAAVNFSLASSQGLAALQAAWQERPGGLIGEPQQVRIELAFAAWPRPWQAAAGAWLGESVEGGAARGGRSGFSCWAARSRSTTSSTGCCASEDASTIRACTSPSIAQAPVARRFARRPSSPSGSMRRWTSRRCAS